MLQAIAALIGSGLNLAGGVNASEASKYQRYLDDRNAGIYAAQQARQMRNYSNLVLLIGAVLIAVIIGLILYKASK